MFLSWRRKRIPTGRRLVVCQLCSPFACLLLVATYTRPSNAASPNAPLVRAVESVGMTVADVDRSIRFYSKVLSFEKISDIELQGVEYEHLEGVFALRIHVVAMRLGDESIELTEYLTPQGRPVPSDSRSNDRWFQHIAIITSDMDRAYSWLRENRVQQVSTGPQTLPDYIKSAAGIRAFYFEDPDGHPLEILEFPPDKGDPKWRHANGKLFLGIDHTAIAVAQTSASLQFYRDILGFRVAGESENYGSEQEHLSNVFGARLRITSLRSREGPGIELLEYLAPGGGRAMPGDEHANDVVHHQTRLVTDNIDAALNQMEEGRYQLVSSGIVTFAKAEIGFHFAVIVRDPDGHAIELVKK
jgi:catechol 2,3-dioxygenase-like lactoylglutathione lyase family enzyme